MYGLEVQIPVALEDSGAQRVDDVISVISHWHWVTWRVQFVTIHPAEHLEPVLLVYDTNKILHIQHHIRDDGGWPGANVIKLKMNGVRRCSVRDKTYKAWIFRGKRGKALRAGETSLDQTQEQAGSRHRSEEKGESFISTLLEWSGNGSKPHTELGFQRN